MAALPQAFHIRPRVRISGQTATYTAVLGVVALFTLYPVFLLLVNSFQVAEPGESASFSLEAWRNALTSTGIRTSLLNTAKVLLLVQGISFPIAVIVAWILARTDIPGSKWLEFGFWIAFFIPTLGVTQGWILMLDPNFGLFNTWLMKLPGIDSNVFNIYSMWGIVFVHLGTFSIAIKVMLLTPIFRNMDASLEDASRISGAGVLGTLTRVVVPLMSPALIAVFIMGTVAGMNAFEVEQVLGFPARFFVYSTKIFGQARASPSQFDQATALGVMVLVVMVPMILAQQQLARRRRYTTVTGQIRIQRSQLRRWRWPALAFVGSLIAFTTVVPFIFMLVSSFMNLFGYFDIQKVWTVRHWQEVLTDPLFTRGLRNSIIVSLGTAAGAVVLFTMIAYIIVRTQFFGRRALSFLSWIPFSMPGVILGLGFLWFSFSIPVLKPLYGSIWLLIIVNILTVMTLGVQMFQSALANLGMDLEEASQVIGASWWSTFRKIFVPIIAPTIGVVAVLAFVSAMRQVATVSILIVGDNNVLSTLQLNFIIAGEFEGAGVVGTIILLMSIAFAAAVRLITLRTGLRA